ncbi:hypothetical protein HFO24_04970 [Rhizobium laguerreae]|uniref:hypothetical protein n=1 Tax=Rhizobium laguerreae TaxID=1076926 RepID=UPI001C927E51|nr:hypothetical protein [Rhizobium laguerreae]MBY3181023.1 hypothetical protein [Rhizobium laguerreae]
MFIFQRGMSFAHGICVLFKILKIKGLIVCGLLLCVGCAPSLTSGPQRLNSNVEDTASVKAQFGHVDFANYLGRTPSDRVSYRNNLIAARMYAIDVAYTQYESSLTTESQTIAFFSSTATNALTGTATLITPVATKNILTGSASFLNATTANYNDSVLFKQTTQILQTQMRANRAAVASLIIRRMRQSDSDYPLAFALSDIEEYYRAGTLTGALVKANATVSDAEQIAQGDKEAAIEYSLSRENASTLLRNSLVQNGKYNRVQAERLKALLRQRGVTERLEIVISNPKYNAEAAQLARDAGLMN